jgi:hypothetical protein
MIRGEHHPLAAPDLALGVGRRVVDTDFSVLHPGGQAAARMLGQQARQRLVEAQAGALGGDFEDARPVGDGLYAIIGALSLQGIHYVHCVV